MTGRIDVSFLGREPRPILVKTARRIAHDAKWRGWKDRTILASTCILAALIVWGVLIVVFAL